MNQKIPNIVETAMLLGLPITPIYGGRYKVDTDPKLELNPRTNTFVRWGVEEKRGQSGELVMFVLGCERSKAFSWLFDVNRGKACNYTPPPNVEPEVLAEQYDPKLHHKIRNMLHVCRRQIHSGKSQKELLRRGISMDAAMRAKLGYSANDDALIVPSLDIHGNSIGYTKRWLSERSDGSRYSLNSKLIPRESYYFTSYWGDESSHTCICVVEGNLKGVWLKQRYPNIDVIALRASNSLQDTKLLSRILDLNRPIVQILDPNVKIDGQWVFETIQPNKAIDELDNDEVQSVIGLLDVFKKLR